MLKHLIILLADDSISYCHWSNKKAISRRLMSLETLRQSILFAMKENLMVQFVYPAHAIPAEYQPEMERVDHINIKPLNAASPGDIAVCDDIPNIQNPNNFSGILTIHTTIREACKNGQTIIDLLERHERINLVFTDIPHLNDELKKDYQHLLRQIAKHITGQVARGNFPQLNILTDRIVLSGMNNCNAGIESVSVAPDGNFYICPAFYFSDMGNIGNLKDGLKLKNSHLLSLQFAPICSHCDAFHCHRCIYLNKIQTMEVNTPGKEQCEIAHIERNLSKSLLEDLQHIDYQFNNIHIPEIDYLDPFERKDLWEE